MGVAELDVGFDEFVAELEGTIESLIVANGVEPLDEVEIELLELDEEEEDGVEVDDVEVTGTTVLEKVVPLVLD